MSRFHTTLKYTFVAALAGLFLLPASGQILPPSILKSFGAETIPVGGTTILEFLMTNPSASTASLTGLAFTDTLPAGLVVSGLNFNLCGGTVTATTGASSVSLSGASLAPGVQCAVEVSVTGTTAGVQNNSVTVTSTNGGTGNTNTASVTVLSPPTIAKSFGAAAIAVGGSTSLGFMVTNPNSTGSLTGIAFTDTLPAGLVVSTPSVITGTCDSGTITATAGASTVSLSGATRAAGASCTFSVSVTGTTAGVQNNSVQVTSTNGGTGNTGTASVTVIGPPSISKSFGASAIGVGASTSLSFTVTNPNTVGGLTGLAFTDTLPAGIVVSTPSVITGTCDSGTITATAGASSVSLSGASRAAGVSCTFSVSVTGTTAGVQNNSVTVTSTNGGTGNTATASMAVVSPPTISKSFGPATLAVGASTSLSFTVTNPNAAGALNGLAFTDTLPSGLVVSTPSVITGSCGAGTITATAGASTISLSGASRAAGASCTFSVSVTGTTAGVQNNSVTVTSTNGGTGNTATASITVVNPPTISKSFGAATLGVGKSTSLSFTVGNPNAAGALNGLAFTDTLPAGLVVSTPSVITGTCGAGTITATAGASTVSLSGASRAAGASCTFSVSVTGTTAGVQDNSVTVTSTNGGTGNTGTASITVVNPPTISKSFGAAMIAAGSSTSLSFIVTNPNTVGGLAGIAFTDTLPAGLVVSTPSVITGTCDSGTITATAGASTVSLSGATRAAGASCTFSVSVTGTAAGVQNNSVTVTSTNGGTGNTGTASITVTGPPSISKSFGAAAIAVGGSTSLSFTVTNSNATSLTGVAFTDSLPSGLVVSTPNGLTGACGGGAITATAGSSSVSLSGATLAASSNCTFSVNVTGTTEGVQNNSVSVTSTNGGTGNTGTASIAVLGPPSISKSFGASTVALGGSTSLSFTIANPNTTMTLTGVAFTDTLPAGLVVSTPNGLTGTCGGGTIAAAAGSSSVSLSGASLPASASCTFSVNVTGTAGGLQTNSVVATSANAGAGNTATATITVVVPPSIGKNFTALAIPVGSSTGVTFSIINPNVATSLSGVSFTDTLPAGLLVATPNALMSSCSGVATATSGSNTVTLTGASLAAGATCTVSVDVIGTRDGAQINSVTVSSDNGGTGNTASAQITVGNAFSINYAANLNIGDSYIDFTNSGSDVASSASQNICVNLYAFDPAEELIGCCSCSVTPNALQSVSVVNALINKPLTPAIPTAIVIKAIATAGATCNPSVIDPGSLASGLKSWRTTLHQNTSLTATTYATAETPLLGATLMTPELTHITSTCGFIQSNGSGFGICGGCSAGGLGAATTTH